MDPNKYRSAIQTRTTTHKKNDQNEHIKKSFFSHTQHSKICGIVIESQASLQRTGV
jgi:hypothetical protein